MGNFIVFEFTLLLPRICFRLFRLEPSKNSPKLAKLVQSVNRRLKGIAWLWHSSHLGTGRLYINYLWVSDV